MKKIMVIVGVKDGSEILSRLIEANFDVYTVICTNYGSEQIEVKCINPIHNGNMNLKDMIQFINLYEIDIVVDVSHSYSREVTSNAIVACKQLNKKYIRYEKNEIKLLYDNIYSFSNYIDAAKESNKYEGNILLTTGSKIVDIISKNIKDYEKRLWVKFLADSKKLDLCLKSGIPISNIICMKGPFTTEMNIELIKLSKAKIIITKNNGTLGNTDKKLEASKIMGIKTFLIEQNIVNISNRFEDIDDVINQCLM